MESFEKSKGSPSGNLRELIKDTDIEALERLESEHPDLLDVLERITDPSVSSDSFFEAIKNFNSSNMREKEGSYEAIHLRNTKHGDVTVKYYKNGSVSISGSYR